MARNHKAQSGDSHPRSPLGAFRASFAKRLVRCTNLRKTLREIHEGGDLDAVLKETRGWLGTIEYEAILNDSALVDGLRRHDPAAVKHLTDCFLPSVWRFVYVRVKGDRHLAEDIVSESVLALIRAVSDPELEIGNPVAWLRSVAAHKVVDHFRAAARVQHLIDQAKQAAPVSNDKDAVTEQELLERREEIRQVLDRLPEQTRLALEWKYIDKLSVKEIADRLDVTEKAAESILFRGRKEFRQRILMKEDQNNSPAATSCNGCRQGIEMSERVEERTDVIS